MAINILPPAPTARPNTTVVPGTIVIEQDLVSSNGPEQARIRYHLDDDNDIYFGAPAPGPRGPNKDQVFIESVPGVAARYRHVLHLVRGSGPHFIGIIHIREFIKDSFGPERESAVISVIII